MAPFRYRCRTSLRALSPDTTLSERQAVLEGLTFLHNAIHGKRRLGADQEPSVLPGLPPEFGRGRAEPRAIEARNPVFPDRPAYPMRRERRRSTPTNFKFTSLVPATGGGAQPIISMPLNDTGRTAAFTVFRDLALRIRTPPITPPASASTIRSTGPVMAHRDGGSFAAIRRTSPAYAAGGRGLSSAKPITAG